MQQLEAVFEKMLSELPSHERDLANYIWEHKDAFIKWPNRKHLLMKVIRTRYHVFPEDIVALLQNNGLQPNTLSNGPAINSYLFAGGERPLKKNGHGWDIHHIYDGRHPFPGHDITTDSAGNELYFTEAAGLVALHPVAHKASEEMPYLAW